MAQKKAIHPIESISALVLTHSRTPFKIRTSCFLQENNFLIGIIALVIQEKIF